MKCYNCKREIPKNSLFCNWCGKYQLDEKNKSADDIRVPTPKQLPSGAWRIQLRKEGISVTNDTFEGCREAAIKARRQWAFEHPAITDRPSMTLAEAADRYLSDRGPVRSPATIRGYSTYRRNRFQNCLSWDIFDPNVNWQAAINEEIEADLTPKTISNAWRFYSAAIRYAKAPIPNVVLPGIVHAERPWLTYKQIPVFLEAIEGKPWEIGALLALHSLRLSELLALRPSNISLEDEKLLVRGARVLNRAGKLEYKQLNKTEVSRRDVPILIPRLKTLLSTIDMSAEFIYDVHHGTLYRRVNSTCKKLGFPEVGVHGLRHSFASLAYHLDWKEMSTMQVGGWKNSKIVHAIYTHNADLEEDIQRMKRHYEA